MMFKLQKQHIGLALGVGTMLAASLASCVSIPKGAHAVSPFKVDRYLGKWYEIARMDFKFEKT